MAGRVDESRADDLDDEIEFIPQARRAIAPPGRPLAGSEPLSPARDALEEREPRSQGLASLSSDTAKARRPTPIDPPNDRDTMPPMEARAPLRAAEPARDPRDMRDQASRDQPARDQRDTRDQRELRDQRDQREPRETQGSKLHARFAPRLRTSAADTAGAVAAEAGAAVATGRSMPPPLPQVPAAAQTQAAGASARLFWVRLFTTLLLTTVMALVMSEWYAAGKMRDIAMGVIFLPLIVQSLAELFLPGRDHRALGLWSTDMVGAAALVVWALGGPVYFGVLGGAMLAIGLVMALLLSSKSPKA